jgi:hypothetical protein
MLFSEFIVHHARQGIAGRWFHLIDGVGGMDEWFIGFSYKMSFVAGGK